jgi:uncharacterized protein
VTVEPRVEDLLASIRKAIDDDLGGAGSSTSTNSQGTLMRGALREMRVNYGGESADQNNADSEIIKLRERIGRSRIESTFTAPRFAAPKKIEAIAPPVQREFSSILAAPIQPTPPPLRKSITDDEAYEPRARRSAPPYQQQVWEQPEEYVEPATYAEQEPQPYYQDENYAHPQQAALVSPQAAYAAQASFQALSDTILARATGDRGLEDMTRDMLRVMLKNWLDDNLPSVVERLVREEIERVARR